jgi:hypothetical protein
MPEDYDERAGFAGTDPGELDEFDDDDVDDVDAVQGAGYPPPPPARQQGRRWLPGAVTALVAAGLAFGIVDVAVRDVTGSSAASATPGAGAPGTSPGGAAPGAPAGGAQPLPLVGGNPSALPSGAMMQLEIGGPVTAVSATSITIGRGDRAVTAAVTGATRVTGKAAGIGGIKVGDLVSASLSGPAGKLVAVSIQDPASLPAGPGQ